MAVITGDSSANLLNGTSSADEISRLGGNDTLNGAGGNDTLIGGVGVDRLVGGAGNDTYIIDASDTLVEVSGAGTDTVRANFSYTLLANFQNLILTGAASINGTGNSVANRITGNDAANTLDGGGGRADVFNAGAGNDLIRVSSTTFRHVDGGSGTDTLAILGGGRTLDLTALANNKISGIEKIDITGGGNNTLELSMLDLLALSDTTNQLRVDGNTGDTVNLDDAWSAGTPAGGYVPYTQGAATILIDSDISVFFV